MVPDLIDVRRSDPTRPQSEPYLRLSRAEPGGDELLPQPGQHDTPQSRLGEGPVSARPSRIRNVVVVNADRIQEGLAFEHQQLVVGATIADDIELQRGDEWRPILTFSAL
jgi:hypothetical protein